MRISNAVRVGLAAAWLVAATAAAGCSTTVDGVAICPGCGIGANRTSRPPAQRTGVPTPTRPLPPPGAETLEPSSTGYVYIETRSGKTRCQLSADTVGCESEFTDSPVIGGEQATGVEVSSDGSHRWVVGNLGAMPTTTIDYSTYTAVGWIIDADSSGTASPTPKPVTGCWSAPKASTSSELPIG